MPDTIDWFSAALSVSGLAVFGLAWRWDRQDLARRTWRTDVAFWLHLLAAPMIVHPLFTRLSGGGSLATTLAVVALYAALALVSLAIDRRALMVSALAYVLYALRDSLERQGVVGLGLAWAALAIGAALLLLSAQWHCARARVLNLLSPAWQAHLPPRR